MLDKDDVKQLFDNFEMTYGYRWAERHKTPEKWHMALSAWTNELSIFDMQDMQDAFEILRKNEKMQEYPPTMFQFSAFCKQARKINNPNAIDTSSMTPGDQLLALAVSTGTDILDFVEKLREVEPDFKKIPPRIIYRNLDSARYNYNLNRHTPIAPHFLQWCASDVTHERRTKEAMNAMQTNEESKKQGNIVDFLNKEPIESHR